MGLVIKGGPNMDLYGHWGADGVAGFTEIGTRATMAKVLPPAVHTGITVEQRLDRADRFGTSSTFGEGGFTDAGLMMTDSDPCWLERANFGQCLALLRDGRTAEAAALLEPHPDGLG